MAAFDFEKKFDLQKARAELSGDRITVGLATCGLSAGGLQVFDALTNADLGLLTEKVGCSGMCYNEPIVNVKQNAQNSIYAKVTKENVDKLIDSIKNKQENAELFCAHALEEIDFFKKQKRWIMQNCGFINPLKVEQYIAAGGYSGLLNAVKIQPKEVVEEIKKSGLRGRGGAGFSTGQKWSFIASKPGKKYLICNGDEGDPGAFMNRTVMESDPFKIIEGMAIGAFATRSDEGIIYTRAEYPLAIKTLQEAIDIAYEKNLLGKNILGIEGFNFDLIIQKGAGAFVCGEETALINSIEGKRGMPNPRPPYPAEKGLYGLPTVINNVGTWANVSVIMNIGASEYSKVGTEKTKGTKEICLTGKINRTGIAEVPMGTKLREIIFDIGGGVPQGTEFKAVLSGGPAGGCIPAQFLDTPLDYETLQSLGAIMGSGGLVVINNESCMVEVARYFMNFTQEESCGKCTPCREGTKRLLEMITSITRGVGKEEDVQKIKALAEFVRDNSLCGLGQNASNPLLSTIKYFPGEYVSHLKDKKCCAGQCAGLMKFIITDNCTGCGNCARHCPVSCISGKPKEKYLIGQEKCTKCGTCYDVCVFKAIKKE